MADLVLTTFDWIPEMPRGYVRDICIPWALEEAGLPYRVASVPFKDRKVAYFAHQPFGQVPWLTDGDISIFESGAILLLLGERSSALLPTPPRACRGYRMAVRGAQFRRDGEPALVLTPVLRRYRKFGMKAV